jgi:demethylmenaquinone methyltransferase / 2-methoxy-6-polyprenyl-1,4-benzoquinol methylase
VPETLTPPRGTQPAGAHTPEEASRRVREMFGRIAPRYDLLNHLLSLQLDRLWRRRVARRVRDILRRPDAVVLDLCCGTGDLALALAGAGTAHVLGADFAHSMLLRAREKAAAASRRNRAGEAPILSLLEADALRLPFADSSFDLVASAFGFRNLAAYEVGLLEMLRVLKPGGTLAILEFAEPRPGFFGSLYRWYSRAVLPRIGGLISRDRSAYAYLPASISKFFQPEELAAAMSKAGYDSVRFELWAGGAVALHMGKRPG